MIGVVFGNYEIVAMLDEGGMGTVFLAQHRRISRRAAIKVLAPELTKNPQVLKRFFNEARATSLIRHPGIVEVYDCDVDAGGRAYIVMEYLEGETLATRLERQRALPWQAACGLARQIADAVGAAHERGIVHRDLKPENVFLVGSGPGTPVADAAIKVFDFGIAKLLAAGPSSGSSTRAGSLLGTPAYMSPEQCGGPGQVDHRADVYSLGCMLFEMVCGRPPFDKEGMRELLADHMFRPPPLASQLVPTIPAWLDEALTRMLAKRPDERPGSMRDVVRALAPLAADAAPETATQAVPAPRPRRRRLTIAGALGVVAVAASLFGMVRLRAPRPAGHALAAAARQAPAAVTRAETGRREPTPPVTPAPVSPAKTPTAARGEAGPQPRRSDTDGTRARRARTDGAGSRGSRAPRQAVAPSRAREGIEMDGLVDL